MESVALAERGVGQPGRMGWADLARGLWSRPYRRALAWAAPLLLLAYGFAMANFTLAGDDWFAVFPQSTLDTDYALAAGRWLMPLVWAATGHGAFVPFFSFAVALGLLALAGLVAAALWGLTRPGAICAVVALSVVNPLLTDALSTKPGHVSFPLGMLCATLAGWVLLRWRGALPWRVAAAAALLVASLASYQPTALAFAVAVIGWEVVEVARGNAGYRRQAGRRWLEIAAAVVAGLAVYWASVRVAWWATGTAASPGRSDYSLTTGYPTTPGEIASALRYGLRMTGRFWFGGTALYPLALKAADLALVAAGALTALGMAARARRGTRGAAVGTGAWLLLLAAASLVAPFAVLFLRDEPPLRGSVFTTAGLAVGFWGGLFLERVTGREPGGRRRLAGIGGAALVLLAVLGGAHQVNQGYFGLYLSNQRDLANANRMLSVMEQMTDFGEGVEVPVALVGRVGFYLDAEPFASRVPGAPGASIVNCSGLSCQDHLVSMLNLIGGGERAFVGRPVPRDPAVRAEVDAMPEWPEPGSIRFLGGVFVVKGSG